MTDEPDREQRAPDGRSRDGSWVWTLRARRPWLALALSQLLFVVVLAPLVYYQTFGIFVDYDDEGYMMMTVKHMLDGHRLYDEVCTLYGPVYFAYKWLVHGLAGLPLTHDVVRLTACGVRLAIGVVASVAVFALVRSVALAAAAQALVTTFLMIIRWEPGHPQELASLLTMIAVAIPALLPARERRSIAMALGVAVGLLAMVKANLGVFAGIAGGMAMLCAARRTGIVLALQIVACALLLALPVLFMRHHLHLSSAAAFAVATTAALMGLSALTIARDDGRGRVADVWWYAAACVVTIVLVGLGTMLGGTSLHALVDCLVLSPMRLPGLFYVPFRAWSPWFGAVAVVLALVARSAGHKLPEAVVLAAKLAFALFVFVEAWSWHPDALATGAMPFIWLTMLSSPDGERTDRLARLVLCWFAVLNVLQAYPVAGSQTFFGTVLLVLCAAVCMGDVAVRLGAYGVTRAGAWIPGAAGAALQLTLVLVCAGAGLSAQRAYERLVPLGLPGAERIHLSRKDARTYRDLATFVRGRASTLFNVPGFNSLYFWTGTEPPTLDVVGHVMGLYSTERQVAMLGALFSAKRPMVVRFVGLAPPSEAFERRLEHGFEPVAQFGPFQVLGPRTPRSSKP